MLGNKLKQILISFDKREMTRFCEFVHSPYYNKHEKVQALISHLNEHFPDIEGEDCAPNTLYQHLYPGEAFEKNKLSVVFTYSQRLVEDFLSLEKFQGRAHWKSILLLENLRQRKINGLYEKNLQKVSKTIEDETLSNRAQLFDHYLLSAEKYDYYDGIGKRQEDFSFQEKQNALDYFYLAEKFKDACEKQVRSKILNVDYRSRLMDAAIAEIEHHQRSTTISPEFICTINSI
jgi:hypothetical protein